MTDRICCLVFGCKRTCPNKREFDEWICQNHWRVVSKDLRSLYFKARRRAVKIPSDKNINRTNRFWERCKSAAINENFGIGMV